MSEISAVEARRSYDEYFRLCVQWPNLASYESARKHHDIPKASHLWDSYETEAARYTWFLAYALKVFDDLLTYDGLEDWKKSVIFQLEMHRPALAAIWPDHWSKVYSGQLGMLVERVIEGPQ